MHELKFRCWDTVSKKFLWPWPDGFSIFGETTCFDLIVDQLHELRPDVPRLELINDIKIMQFTGLKDRDVKDVYEGDIVKEGGMLGIVMYDLPYAKFCYKTKTATVGLYGFYGTVVGNIYENPDLLNNS